MRNYLNSRTLPLILLSGSSVSLWAVDLPEAVLVDPTFVNSSLVGQNVTPLEESSNKSSWKKAMSPLLKFFTKKDLKTFLVKAYPEEYLKIEEINGYEEISYSEKLSGELSKHTQTYDIEKARELAKLAYCARPEECGVDISSLKLKTFQAETGLFSSSLSHCGFVGERDETFLVSIRGTMTLSDWGTNINSGIWDGIRDPALLGISGQVHSGFYHYGKSVFENIWPDLLIRINERFQSWIQTQPRDLSKEEINKGYANILKNTNFEIQGHSLGGAGAQIVALMIKKDLQDKIFQIDGTSNFDSNLKLFTFEAPRVCNKQAAVEFDNFVGKQNHIRVIQKDPSAYLLHTDPVTSVSPGALGFKHTGTLFLNELETKEDRESASFHLHSMAPIKSVDQGFEKGEKNVSTMRKVFRGVKKLFSRQ